MRGGLPLLGFASVTGGAGSVPGVCGLELRTELSANRGGLGQARLTREVLVMRIDALPDARIVGDGLVEHEVLDVGARDPCYFVEGQPQARESVGIGPQQDDERPAE